MIAALRGTPPWAWLALAIALALLYQQHRIDDLQVALADERAAYQGYVAQITGERERAQAAARREEQRRQGAFDQVRDDARDEIARADQRADAADAKSRGLQQQVDRMLAERTRGSAGDSTPAGRGAAVADYTDVLAELLRRADRRAGALARIADQSRARGLACELAFDALSASQASR